MAAIDIAINPNRYIIWLWRVDVENAELHRWKGWRKIYPYLSKLLNLSKYESWIFSEQIDSATRKKLPFGRMKWSDENNQKWTERYQKSDNHSNKAEFVATFVISPHPNFSKTEDVATKIFSDLIFDSVGNRYQFFIAIHHEHFENNRLEVLSEMKNIESEIGRTHVLFERPWSIRSGVSERNPLPWASIPFLQENYEETRFLTKDELKKDSKKQSLFQKIFRI